MMTADLGSRKLLVALPCEGSIDDSGIGNRIELPALLTDDQLLVALPCKGIIDDSGPWEQVAT